VTVTEENNAPTANNSGFDIPEDGSANLGILSLINDPDGDALSIATLTTSAGGSVTQTSDTSFRYTPDPDFNGMATVTYSVTDGQLVSNEATINITVTPANDAPVVTSANAISIPENATAVLTIAATDVENDPLTYAIAGGADAALFAIDPTTGDLSFIAAPDFEAPADTGADNVYDVQVSASDGTDTTTQDIAVTVTDIDETTPTLTVSLDPTSIGENDGPGASTGTVTRSDTAGDLTVTLTNSDTTEAAVPTTVTLLDGVASATFQIDAVDDLAVDGDQTISITATAAGFTSGSADLLVTDNEVANNAPTITSPAAFTIAENGTAVGTITSTDPENDTVTYAISGGADSNLFSIDASTGDLSFASAPDFEAPADAGADNIYDVEVSASDGVNAPVTQDIAITVDDVDESTPGTNGSGELIVMKFGSSVQDSNFPKNSFRLENKGDKVIVEAVIDVSGALYPDSVFDPFGVGGDYRHGWRHRCDHADCCILYRGRWCGRLHRHPPDL